MPDIQLETLELGIGIGTIDPASRIDRGEITEAEVDDFVEALKSDEFYDRIDPKAIPCTCVDGRCGHGPSAAGGTFSIVVADALYPENSYRKDAEKAPEHAKRIYAYLTEEGFKVGGHNDDGAIGDKSGCGAEDKLGPSHTSPDEPSILNYIAANGEKVRALAQKIGVLIDDETHSTITGTAATLIKESYATTGKELESAYVAVAGTGSVETVHGEHTEAVAIINTQPGWSLNRQKLRAAYGDNLKAFTLDVPAVSNGIYQLNPLSEHEQAGKFAAAVYYNIATTAVLAGPSLRIIVR